MILAVVPVFNEACTLGRVVAGVAAFCEVIVVDDASTDASAAVASRAGAACVVRHPVRRGKGAALRAGFAEALSRGAAGVATLDGDGQHDPADLPRLLAAARRVPGALVLGDRLAATGGDPIPPLRSRAVRTADWCLGHLTGVPLRDTQCGFRLYPAALLRALRLREEGFVLETEVLVRAARAGYPLVSVPVRRIYPAGRRSRFRGLVDGSRIGWYLARAAADRVGRRLAPGGAALPALAPDLAEMGAAPAPAAGEP